MSDREFSTQLLVSPSGSSQPAHHHQQEDVYDCVQIEMSKARSDHPSRLPVYDRVQIEFPSMGKPGVSYEFLLVRQKRKGELSSTPSQSNMKNKTKTSHRNHIYEPHSMCGISLLTSPLPQRYKGQPNFLCCQHQRPTRYQ